MTDKVSQKDFELLLDELENVVAQCSKPGASTMNHALHEARQALIEAARRGVDDSDPAVTPTDYRRALVQSLLKKTDDAQAQEFGEKLRAFIASAGDRFEIEKDPPRPPVNPKYELIRGMKAIAPFAMAIPTASEIEKGLAKVRAKCPELKIDVAVAETAGWTNDDLERLRHTLRLAGEEVYLERPENAHLRTRQRTQAAA